MSETVTIESVDEKSGHTNGRDWTRYRVKLADGRWLTTFKAAQGGAAQRLSGQLVEVDITEKPGKDGTTDLMLDAVRPAAGATQAAGTENTAPSVPAAPGADADKDRQIARMAAVKAAAALLSGTGATVNDLTAAAGVVETWIYRRHLTDDDIPF